MKMNKLLSTLFIFTIILISGCGDVTGGKSGGSASITREAVEYYLSEHKLNSPGVAAEVTTKLNNGGKYREQIKDENKKLTTLTAWIDVQDQNMFCITYYRDQVCPKCKGTGLLTLPNKIKDAMSSKLNTSFGISCNQCGGTGYLKKAKMKKCWLLGVADYKDPQAAIAREEEYSLQGAPANTKKYIDQLASSNPQERLDACIWLDKNYIREGLKLVEITSILDRARFISPLEDKSIMRKIMGKASNQQEFTVYQFWAGKGDPALAKRAYYRIYVNASKGEVIKTAFAPELSANQRRRR